MASGTNQKSKERSRVAKHTVEEEGNGIEHRHSEHPLKDAKYDTQYRSQAARWREDTRKRKGVQCLGSS